MNIVTISNQQYIVSKGDKLFIPKQAATIGDSISLRVLMSVNGDENFIPNLETHVQAKVLAHVKGEKIIVFKKKRRKRYRRTKGHRQQFTQIEIVS